MSYTSESELPTETRLPRVFEIIELLGFQRIQDRLNIENRLRSFFWYNETEYKSWVGVELDVYQEEGRIIVTTRSRAGRSYWDLSHQNKTIKLIRDLFGGHFITDAGRNRYWHPEEPPPSTLSSGCFLARWRFDSSIQKAKIYLSSRRLEGNIARNEASGLVFMDELNPRLLSNNLIVPFIIAVWEDYFRSTFTSIITSINNRETVLKKANISRDNLERIATGEMPIHQAISECFSFQRPSLIGRNFQLVDRNLDIASALRAPYRNRRTSLYDTIEKLVEGRNAFVHAGHMDMNLYDRQIHKTLDDITVAVDRSYNEVGRHFDFDPIRTY